MRGGTSGSGRAARRGSWGGGKGGIYLGIDGKDTFVITVSKDEAQKRLHCH